MKKYEYNSLNKEQLKELIIFLGEKPFRAKQLFEHLHKHKIYEIDDISV